MRRAVLATVTLLCLTCCRTVGGEGPAEESRLLGEGVWGGAQETLAVTPDGAVFDGICVRGTIAVPFAVSREGEFELPGRLERRGGKQAVGERAQAVRFVGKVDGEMMTLSVVGSDRSILITTKLQKGVRGNPRQCP